jgi:hypothetical protein
MGFSFKDVGVDVRSRDRAYGRSCYSGRTDPSPDVLSECDRETLFSPPSYSSYFLVIELCFSRNRIDDRSFLNIRGYGASRELHGRALRPG